MRMATSLFNRVKSAAKAVQRRTATPDAHDNSGQGGKTLLIDRLA